MHDWNTFVNMLNDMVDTRDKRHVVGGVLLSISLFFGGLAITAITIKEDEQ